MDRRGQDTFDARLLVLVVLALAVLAFALYFLFLGKDACGGITDAVKGCETQANIIYPGRVVEAKCFQQQDCKNDAEQVSETGLPDGQSWVLINSVGKACDSPDTGKYCCALVKPNEP